MCVGKRSDELWVGVKGYSSPVIAGSPAYQPLSNSEYHSIERSSETVGGKLHCRKGNSPDQQLRCQNHAKWKGGGVS